LCSLAAHCREILLREHGQYELRNISKMFDQIPLLPRNKHAIDIREGTKSITLIGKAIVIVFFKWQYFPPPPLHQSMAGLAPITIKQFVKNVISEVQPTQAS